MFSRLWLKIQPLVKASVALCLAFILVFSQADHALAARSGGRIGGGSFRAPSRTYSPRTAPRGGYGYPGGGIGFPFIFPLFGFGGGGLFTLLIFMAIASFLVRNLGNAGGDEDYAVGGTNPTVSVAKVQVGLLSNARSLKGELDQIALSANTDTAEGRALVLQEASLALLRHPEYWVYGATESYTSPLSAAEGKFNQLALAERSKFAEETLSNVSNRLKQSDQTEALPEAGGQIISSLQNAKDYIVVTLIAGFEGKVQLSSVNEAEDVEQALRQMGGLGGERLLAFEVLWTPQREGDTLTTEDILASYPNLKLV